MGSPPPCLQTARLYSKNTITETIRSIWFAKPQETERDSPGSPAPRVPPIRILGAGDQDPFPLTTQWKLTSTQPNSPLSLYKFWQCSILTQAESNPENKGNKPSPASMLPHPRVNQQLISKCPSHPLRNQSIRQKLSWISSLEYCRGRQKHRLSQSQSFHNPVARRWLARS